MYKGENGYQWKPRFENSISVSQNLVNLVFATIKVQEHAGNDKSCVWHAPDFSDGELKVEMFCIRFGSVENCKKFMETIEGIAESLGKNEEKESKDATTVADLLDKLSVGEGKTETKAEGEASKQEAPAAAEEEKQKTKTKAEGASSAGKA